MEDFWTYADGRLGLTVAARVPATSDHDRAGRILLVNLPAADVLTVVPNARVGACPDLLCPNDSPRIGAGGTVYPAPLVCCWTVTHQDGTVSHGWADSADCAAAAHTYPTAPEDQLFIGAPAVAMVVESGWTVAARDRSARTSASTSTPSRATWPGAGGRHSSGIGG